MDYNLLVLKVSMFPTRPIRPHWNLQPLEVSPVLGSLASGTPPWATISNWLPLGMRVIPNFYVALYNSKGLSWAFSYLSLSAIGLIMIPLKEVAKGTLRHPLTACGHIVLSYL